MSLWEPPEVHTVKCDYCPDPKRPHEMGKSETVNICIECSEKEMKIQDEFFKQMRRRAT